MKNKICIFVLLLCAPSIINFWAWISFGAEIFPLNEAQGLAAMVTVTPVFVACVAALLSESL